jgi:hypothetical protein
MTVREAVIEFVEGQEDYKLYEDYSGRFMYGAKCLGVIVPSGSSYMEFMLQLTTFMCENDVDDAKLELSGVAVDNLGLDYIVYFPRLVTD